MRYSAPRATPGFGHTVGDVPKGPTIIQRAAKDPVQPPQDTATVAIIERCLCRVALGEDCYVVTGMTGEVRIVPYGAKLDDWEKACGELLALAVKSEVLE